jgi:Na+-driven multidrug efflux pump
VKEVLKKTIVYATAVMCFAFLVCELFPHLICGMFTDDDEMTRISASAMRIMIATFPIVGFQMVTSNFFQSIGRAGIAAILSTTRQILFLIPSLLLLPSFFNLNGVWLSIPVSDTLSTIVTAIFLVREYKRIGKER